MNQFVVVALMALVPRRLWLEWPGGPLGRRRFRDHYRGHWSPSDLGSHLRAGPRAEFAGFSDFVVSRDGRWVAGWNQDSPEHPETVSVLSLDGGTCLVVPRNAHQSDQALGFSKDGKSVVIGRGAFAISSLPHC